MRHRILHEKCTTPKFNQCQVTCTMTPNSLILYSLKGFHLKPVAHVNQRLQVGSSPATFKVAKKKIRVKNWKNVVNIGN